MSDITQPHGSAPFDERAALAELEQLADKIQRSRQQRENAVAEFDAFVKAFRYERYSSSIAATDRELRRAEDRAPMPAPTAAQAGRAIAAASATATPAMAPAHAAAAASASGAPSVAETKPAVSTPSPSSSAATVAATGSAAHPPVPQAMEPPAAENTMPWGSGADREAIAHAPVRLPAIRAAHVGVGLGTAAVLAVAVLLWRSSSAPVGPATPANLSVAPSANASAPAAQPETTAAPKPVVPAGPPRALNIEFITTRPVWARITIDGRKAMEKEFPAEQRVPLGADRSILIRAGDAGAIRLVVDGKDLGLLGRDGQIFSRAFTPAAR